MKKLFLLFAVVSVLTGCELPGHRDADYATARADSIKYMSDFFLVCKNLGGTKTLYLTEYAVPIDRGPLIVCANGMELSFNVFVKVEKAK